MRAPGRTTALAVLLASLLAVSVAGCAEVEAPPIEAGSPSTSASTESPSASASSAAALPSASASSAEPPTPAASPSVTLPTPPAVEPRRSYLSIPAIGVRDVPVVRYRGSPDDAPGTVIQNRGPAASPRGPAGGVGPGEVGNFIVTGHRTSHDAPFRDLPAVRRGDHVLVRQAGVVYDYVMTGTLRISFRSEKSKARQSAPVPGRPGAVAVEPMITVSTCATPEDHAAGNFWADEFDNPEHRIDKIGVLTATRPAN